MAFDPSGGPEAVFVDAAGREVKRCGRWSIAAKSGGAAHLTVAGDVPPSAARVSLLFGRGFGFHNQELESTSPPVIKKLG